MGDGAAEQFSAFYKSFSEEFRGPYEVVKARLRVHANYLAKAGTLPGPLVDLGVGRGEWIELAQELGFAVTGIDSNPSIVAGARARGFNVIESDALDYLAGVAPQSLGAITGFHIVEHLTAEQRLCLMLVSFRALAHGGYFVLEWPNIEHPRVGQYTFWLDPTHQTPLPGELATYMAKYVGFTDITLIRIDDGQPVGFEAPDIALWARKP